MLMREGLLENSTVRSAAVIFIPYNAAEDRRI
jgi:hypothetical protein